MTVSTTFDLTAANAALKELYSDQEVHNLVYDDNPLLALVKKNEDFGGKYKPIPIITGVSQGRSSAFATAQANITAPLIESFLLTVKPDYSVANISNQLLESARTNKQTFVEGAKLNVDAAIRTITLSQASAMYRSGTGSIGRIGTGGVSTGVITLADPESVTQFEVNMVLQCTTGTTDGGTPRAAVGYVIAVDRTAGTVTVASSGLGGNAATPGSWAASEYLLCQGDSNAKMSGLDAWIPATAPASTAFYGVDRSADPVRLAGVRYDGSSQSIEEALIDASKFVAREGGKPDYCFTSFTSYAALEKSLGTRIQYCDLKGPADIYFKGLRLNGFKGPINVVPDRNCPGSVAYLLQMNTWALESTGEVPHIIKGDGLDMIRVGTADAYEVRVVAYSNMACSAPGWNARVTLSQ